LLVLIVSSFHSSFVVDACLLASAAALPISVSFEGLRWFNFPPDAA